MKFDFDKIYKNRRGEEVILFNDDEKDNYITWERTSDYFKYNTYKNGHLHENGPFSEMDVVSEYTPKSEYVVKTIEYVGLALTLGWMVYLFLF